MQQASFPVLTTPSERNDDGKSYKNPQHGVRSKAYEVFPDPLNKGQRGGFDIHIYHYQVGIPAPLNHTSSTHTRHRITQIKLCTPRPSGNVSDGSVSIYHFP